MCGAALHPSHRPLTLAIESLLVVVAITVLLVSLWILRPQNIATPSAAALPTAIPTNTRIPTRPANTFTPAVTATSTTVAGAPAVWTYKVKAGDNLSDIAKRFEVSVASIVAASGLKDDKVRLQIGQTLKIPQTSDRSTIDAQMPVTAGLTITLPTAVAPAPAPTTGLPPDAVTHTIKRGEYLETIAKKYGVTIDHIVQVNGFKDAEVLLQIGQVIIIQPGSTPTPAPTPTPNPTASKPLLAPTPSPTPFEAVLAAFTPMPAREFPYPAPALLGPPDGGELRGADSSVLLNWTSVGILQDDESYVVRVRLIQRGQAREVTAWVKATSWRLPDSLRPTTPGETYRYEWDVTVQRQTGTDEGGAPTGEPVSPRSIAHSFTWLP